MSARRNKKMKKLLLPFTFVLGVLAFPLGNMAFDQAKKTGKAMFADEAPKKSKARQVAHQPKKSHKKATRAVAKQKKKVTKKVAKHKKPVKQQRRYAH